VKRGWIKFYRRISEHELWLKKPFSEGQAWADMLLHADKDSCTIQFSQNYWARRWGWTRSKVVRFFEYLTEETMIETIESGKFSRTSATDKSASKLHICNYYNFQQPPDKSANKSPGQYTIIRDITISNLYILGNHWNSKEIINHGPATIAKCEVVFKRNLLPPFGTGDFWTDELCQAICNYATVLHEDKYFWTHKWTLKEFLTRGVDRFANGAKPLENFLVKEKYAAPPAGRVTHTRECSLCRTGWHGIELSVDGLCNKCVERGRNEN
jgi:hypothetical protein